MKKRILSLCVWRGILALLLTSAAVSAAPDSTMIHLNNYSYFYGRQYYVLRSGRTQMFIQADKVDLGSAFTYLLFDAENSHQSARKDSACNYDPRSGFETSALEVKMGGYPFVALGQNTMTRWIYEDGIPKVEAVWWAGGIEVTEKIFALAGANAFERTVTLSGKQIIGRESIELRLGIPEGKIERSNNEITYSSEKGRVSIVADVPPSRVSFASNYLQVSDTISPHETQTFRTFIVTQIPTGGENDFAKRVNQFANGKVSFQRTRHRWAELSSIDSRDSVIQNLYDNVRFTLPGYVSNVGIMDAGVFEYGGQWIRDASNTAEGLIRIGDFDLARSLLGYMLDKMINDNGTTMISSSYVNPEDEEFDQMGELWDALRDYYYWTGDSSLLVDNSSKLIAMTNRPLMPVFLDSTGMVHNKREYWERFLTDGYELAYQVYIIRGLRDAIELAPVIRAEKYVSRWRSAEKKMLHAMLDNPKFKLVHGGAFIKRRSMTGQIVDTVRYRGYVVDAPAVTESLQRLMPDASMALPIILGIVKPNSFLAKKTLEDLQPLWDMRWSFGGYDRYNTSSQPDQPGPWLIATTLILRAEQDAGMYRLSRRTLDWLYHVQGGHTGAFFEEIPINRHQEFTAGILPWPAAEVASFVIKDWLGIRFSNGRMIIKPNLYPGSKGVDADIRYRNSRIRLSLEGSGKVNRAVVNGVVAKLGEDGSVELPIDFRGGTVRIFMK